MRRWSALAGALAGLIVLSCGAVGGPASVRNYYTLDYSPRSGLPVGSERPYPFFLQVDRFDVQRTINRQNIIYRYSPHQLQYYERQRWAVRPADMIRDMVFKHLQQTRLTTRLEMDGFDVRPDFRLHGAVEALERLDAGDLFYGHMAMTFRLIRTETGEEVWTYAFDQRRRVHSAEMVTTVQALSDILQSQMNVVVDQLDSLLLAAATGQTLRPMPVDRPGAEPDEKVPEVPGLDESSFEIIRER